MHILALESSAHAGFLNVLNMRLKCLVLLTEEQCYLSKPLVLLHDAFVLQVEFPVHHLHIFFFFFFFTVITSVLQPEEITISLTIHNSNIQLWGSTWWIEEPCLALFPLPDLTAELSKWTALSFLNNLLWRTVDDQQFKEKSLEEHIILLLARFFVSSSWRKRSRRMNRRANHRLFIEKSLYFYKGMSQISSTKIWYMHTKKEM